MAALNALDAGSAWPILVNNAPRVEVPCERARRIEFRGLAQFRFRFRVLLGFASANP